MLKKVIFSIGFAMFVWSCFSQVQKEVVPPYNIKAISFVQGGQNTIPLFRLGDSFQFQFDDLFGNEANYYYTITHCNYDWKPSQLSKNEYFEIKLHLSLTGLQEKPTPLSMSFACLILAILFFDSVSE